jgi:hypothetical protein
MSMSNSKVQKNNGYMSQGGMSDAGSARMSNRQTFKYNGPNPMNAIRKVSPGMNQEHYPSSGNESRLPTINNNGMLPVVKEGLKKPVMKSRSTNRSSNQYKNVK